MDEDAVIVLEVFSKKSRDMPKSVVDTCRRRLTDYDG